MSPQIAECLAKRALPCPFCGESLVVHEDHHGCWLAHRQEPGRCIESVVQLLDAQDLERWNERSPEAIRSHDQAPTHSKDILGTVGQMREFLARYSDDAQILSQVVGTEDGAWNLFLTGAHGEECGFKWEVQPAILQMSHPHIKVLPKLD